MRIGGGIGLRQMQVARSFSAGSEHGSRSGAAVRCGAAHSVGGLVGAIYVLSWVFVSGSGDQLLYVFRIAPGAGLFKPRLLRTVFLPLAWASSNLGFNEPFCPWRGPLQTSASANLYIAAVCCFVCSVRVSLVPTASTAGLTAWSGLFSLRFLQGPFLGFILGKSLGLDAAVRLAAGVSVGFLL